MRANTDPIADLMRQQAAAEWTAAAARIPVFQVGDAARVCSDSRAGPKSPHVGDVGTVVAIRTKAEALVVYGNCSERVYVLDFGPDDDRHGGRDTWAYADSDLGRAGETAPKRKPRRK